jgi:hypothetical protein
MATLIFRLAGMVLGITILYAAVGAFTEFSVNYCPASPHVGACVFILTVTVILSCIVAGMIILASLFAK